MFARSIFFLFSAFAPLERSLDLLFPPFHFFTSVSYKLWLIKKLYIYKTSHNG